MSHRSLIQRQDAMVCGSSKDAKQYNLGLQIGALFIVLTVSASACAFPLVASKIPRFRIPLKFLFVIRHFGTGVLLATAFVHLLPTAFVSLTNPCLPSFWNEDYPAITGAIALASVFAITSIEMLLSPGRKCCSVRVDQLQVPEAKSGEAMPLDMEPGPLHGRSRIGRSYSNGRGFTRMIRRTQQQNDNQIEPTQPDERTTDGVDNSPQAIDYAHDTTLSDSQKRNRAAVQCVLLEIGILFHSVFIGMSLAVSIGSNLTILLVAITFHQLFEGLALGSRIAAVPWGRSRIRKAQPWLMCLAYGCTTPLGQAIGISTHTLYDPDSMTGLLVVGIMNAISAGLLTFTSLVDLLSEDFLTDESWNVLRGKQRAVAFCLVFLGAFLMSLIGAWA